MVFGGVFPLEGVKIEVYNLKKKILLNIKEQKQGILYFRSRKNMRYVYSVL